MGLESRKSLVRAPLWVQNLFWTLGHCRLSCCLSRCVLRLPRWLSWLSIGHIHRGSNPVLGAHIIWTLRRCRQSLWRNVHGNRCVSIYAPLVWKFKEILAILLHSLSTAQTILLVKYRTYKQEIAGSNPVLGTQNFWTLRHYRQSYSMWRYACASVSASIYVSLKILMRDGKIFCMTNLRHSVFVQEPSVRFRAAHLSGCRLYWIQSQL